MEAYTVFAKVYDEFMKDIPYEEWLRIVDERIGKASGGSKVLELACGSGTFSGLLADKGYEVMGIDISEDMLRQAYGKKIPMTRFVNADMTEFSLSEQFDAAVCVCDGMNYLTCKEDLNDTLRCVSEHLTPGGIFIFDVKKEQYFKELSDSTFSDEIDGCRYVWENYYDEETRDNVYSVTFFIRKIGSLYRKYEEQHLQHVFLREEVTEALEECGYTLKEVIDENEREFYVLERTQA